MCASKYEQPMSTLKYTFINKTLTFKYDIDEQLEPYYFMMYQASCIIFNKKSNSPIILFPNTTHLELGDVYSHSLILTPNIKKLVIAFRYEYSLKCPLKFKSLYIFDCSALLELNKYMKSLTTLCDFNPPTLNLNKCLNYLECSSSGNSSPMLNKNLKQLWGGCSLQLPKNLTLLIISVQSNKILLLPARITYLQVGCVYPDYFILEHSLEHIQLNILVHCSDYYLIDNLPNNKKTITLECTSPMVLNNLPNNLKVENMFY